jgi:3-dehydroquinate synthase
VSADRPVTVEVGLGDRAYDILIGSGLLSRAGEEISRRLPGTRAAVVTDENVAAAHHDTLKAGLEKGGIQPTVITMPPGEKTKSFAHLEAVVDGILAARLERGDVVIALGGGVIGDLTGFAAGIVRRGMNFVQIPTSLLAQVDSSVGGKTGINSARGKNLVGVFHQPRLVLADTRVLDTLPIREFRAGYAELAKYGLIDRPAFFAWLEQNWVQVFAGGPARVEAIAEACRAKADVVARDEFETGDRALLNLGHTFGHALEAETGFGPDLLHGEAVGAGMALAFRFSAAQGICPEADARRVTDHLRAVGLPASLAEAGVSADGAALTAHMLHDKKMAGGKLPFVLARGIGQSYLDRDVALDAVAAFLDVEAGAAPHKKSA